MNYFLCLSLRYENAGKELKSSIKSLLSTDQDEMDIDGKSELIVPQKITGILSKHSATPVQQETHLPIVRLNFVINQVCCHFISQVNCHFTNQVSCHFISQVNYHFVSQVNCHFVNQVNCHFIGQINCHFISQLYHKVIIPPPTKLRRDIVTLPSVLPFVRHILVNTLGSTSFNGF